MQQIDKKFDNIASTSLWHDKTVLERIENNTTSSMHSSAGSMRSLASMASSLSRLEALTTAIASNPAFQFEGRTSPYLFGSGSGSPTGSVELSRPFFVREKLRDSYRASSPPAVDSNDFASGKSTGVSPSIVQSEGRTSPYSLELRSAPPAGSAESSKRFPFREASQNSHHPSSRLQPIVFTFPRETPRVYPSTLFPQTRFQETFWS